LRLPGPDYLAPAKLNLFLHVVGRRADGYHLLQSVFVPIDRCDRLRFAVRADGEVRRVNEVPGVASEDDLAVRAARLLREATGTRQGVDIELEKRIPMGGGLGGGSSDAATRLRRRGPGGHRRNARRRRSVLPHGPPRLGGGHRRPLDAHRSSAALVSGDDAAGGGADGIDLRRARIDPKYGTP
jgi:hypothetical protein